MLRRSIARIIVILSAVVLIIQLMRPLLGLMLGPFAVNEISALCLGELVDFGACKASEEFFGELVRDVFACFVYDLAFDIYLRLSIYGTLPSLRWWSSKVLNARNDAPPASNSWEKLDSCRPSLSWLYCS